MSQLTKTVKMALKSTEEERAMLRARSAVQRFPVVEWRRRTEDFHKRSIGILCMFQCQIHIGVGISPEAEEISKERNTKIVLPLLVTAHEEKNMVGLGINTFHFTLLSWGNFRIS